MERTIETLTIEPKKGRTLAGLFTDYVTEKHTVYGDVELFDASHMHYRVIGNGHPYHDIIDFRSRMDDLMLQPGSPKIELIYDEPEALTERRLDHDTMRVLRSFEFGAKWTNEDDSLLSSECVVDVIRQLHLNNQRQAAEIARLKQN